MEVVQFERTVVCMCVRVCRGHESGRWDIRWEKQSGTRLREAL